MSNHQPNPQVLAELHRLHAQGFSRRVIAQRLNMGKTTVSTWLKRYPMPPVDDIQPPVEQPATTSAFTLDVDAPAPQPLLHDHGIRLVLDPITVDGMDVEAGIQGCSRSDVIAQALRLYLAACHRARNNMHHPIPLTAYLPVT